MAYLAIYAFVNLAAFAVAARGRHPLPGASGCRTTAGWSATSRAPAGRWPSRWWPWPGCRPASSGCSPRSWCSTPRPGPATWLAVVMARQRRDRAGLLRPLAGGAVPAQRGGAAASRYDVPNGVAVAIGMTFTAGVVFSVFPGWLLDPVLAVLGSRDVRPGRCVRDVWLLRWYRLGGVRPRRGLPMTRWTRDRDVDENNVEVARPEARRRRGDRGGGVDEARAGADGAGPHRARPCSSSTRPTASTACRCAWPDPDPDHRHTAEFCENGAKAVAEEATTARVGPEFFAEHSRRRAARAHRLLARQAGPAHRADGAARRARTHYEPIRWDDAFALIGDQLRGLGQPRRGGVLHLRPRVQRGRVRLPAVRPRASAPTTCPTARTCATSRPRSALAEVIGIGKGSVSLEDIHDAELHRDHRPEPGHQPPADADRAGEGQAERRQDRRDQPAAARPA